MISPWNTVKWLHDANVALIMCAFAATWASGAAPRIELTFDPSVSAAPYSGRVYLMMSARPGGRPIDGPNWFRPQPFFSQDVRDWKPGELLVMSPERTLGFPEPLADLPKGSYRVQAVIDLNGQTHKLPAAPGNGISEIATFEQDPAAPATIKLKIHERIPALELKDSETTKYIHLRSRLLSDFFHRDVFMQCAVGLPPAYAVDKDRRFPTVYMIPGFGGTMEFVQGGFSARRYGHDDFEPVAVYLDPDCATGHHVFADSANNGPRGAALVEELIPYLEREFRLIPETGARFVTGHSSGGWSSLWLQITYPDVFGGVWSLSPDPVDFRAFQTINIYDSTQNMFTLTDGSPRLLSRAEWGPALETRRFCLMEETLGRGGQLQSFEAVFSPRGPDGAPLKLWDRKSGALDPKVAEAWRRYDIREVVQKNWPVLGPKLKGKLHLFCGDKDTFLLERAFFRLRDALKELGSDAVVEIVPGAGHGLSRAVFQECPAQMAKAYALWREQKR